MGVQQHWCKEGPSGAGPGSSRKEPKGGWRGEKMPGGRELVLGASETGRLEEACR